MKDFKLIENTNNLKLQNFNFVFTQSTSEYVQQKLKLKLSVFQGEWYLDNTLGINYFEQVFVKNPNINLIEDVFKAKILEVDEVDEILEFNLLFDKVLRKFIIDFVVKIINGDEVSVTI